MAEPLSFSLTASQVPAPPDSPAWVDQLRWAVCVIDPDQVGRMKFLAGCLTYALNRGGLTRKQGEVCQAIIDELIASWRAGELYCQIVPDARARHGQDLASMEPEGRA